MTVTTGQMAGRDPAGEYRNMKIGELAERTGLTPSRIRFYERIGLLTLVERKRTAIARIRRKR